MSDFLVVFLTGVVGWFVFITVAVYLWPPKTDDPPSS